MPDLKIAVATDGPVPDNQCALKDAILFAASSDQEFSQDDVVSAAKAFYAFLQAPADGAPAAASQPTPVQDSTAAGLPVAGAVPPTTA